MFCKKEKNEPSIKVSYIIEKNGLNQYRIVKKFSNSGRNYYVGEHKTLSDYSSTAKMFSTLEEAEDEIKSYAWEIVKKIEGE